MMKAAWIGYPAGFVLTTGAGLLLGDSIPVALAYAATATLGAYLWLGRKAR